MTVKSLFVLGLLFVALATPVRAEDDLGLGIARIEDRWSEIRYEMKGDRAQAAHDLRAAADDLAHRYPNDAAPMVWRALTLSLDADIRHNTSALPLVSEARDVLERAETIDPKVLDGLLQTSLGSLYYEVPSWPLSYRDTKKAQVHLQKALEIDPAGMEANFFYGDFLLQQGKAKEALPYLEKAMDTPPRPGHERYDNGRKPEIAESLAAARKKIKS